MFWHLSNEAARIMAAKSKWMLLIRIFFFFSPSFLYCVECVFVYCIKIVCVVFFAQAFKVPGISFQLFRYGYSQIFVLLSVSQPVYGWFFFFFLLRAARLKCQLLLISLSWHIKMAWLEGDVYCENSTKCGVLFAHLINHTTNCVCQSPNCCHLRSCCRCRGVREILHTQKPIHTCDATIVLKKDFQCVSFRMRVHTIDSLTCLSADR